MTRRVVALSLLVFLILGACSRPDKKPTGETAVTGPPVSGDWAIVRYEAEPDTLNFLLASSSYSNYVMLGVNNSQIYELLMGYNTKDWRPTEPLLIEAPPDVSDDHLTYTLKVRDGIKWHDGQPFTPDDVLFTFKAAMCPLVDSAAYRAWLTDLKDIQVDGRTMRFIMSKPNVFNVVAITNTLAMMPKHVFDAEGLLDAFSFQDIIGPKGRTDPKIKKFADQFNNHPSNRAPIGTGPYKFEKWETGKEIVLTRNDNYWRQKPYLDKIVIRIMKDYPAALTALKAGEIDFNPRLQPIQYAQQTGGAGFDEQFTKVRYALPTYAYIGWNEDRPFFKDKRVRQALTMLIDRQQIIDSVRFGLGKIGVSPLNPASADFDPSIKPLPYDPKRAAELLDEAGWKDHDGDGIRDKDGVKFSFEFLGAVGSTVFPQLSPILRESLGKVGIQVTERVVDFPVMQNYLKDHKFDAMSQQWVSDLYQDPYQIWHSSAAQNRGANFVNFKNAESDRLIEQARLEFDGEKRKQIYWKWQELIADEQPYTFLYYPEEGAAYSKRFQNVQWVPVRPGYDLSTWWVPKALQKYTSSTP